MIDRRINVVWMDRVVVRENGIDLDRPHQFNPETGTSAVCVNATDEDKFSAGFEAGFHCGQQMPQDLIDRLRSPLPPMPLIDVNLYEDLPEDDGLFG